MPTVLFVTISFYLSTEVKKNPENLQNSCNKNKIFDFYIARDTNTANMIKRNRGVKKGQPASIIPVPAFYISYHIRTYRSGNGRFVYAISKR